MSPSLSVMMSIEMSARMSNLNPIQNPSIMSIEMSTRMSKGMSNFVPSP